MSSVRMRARNDGTTYQQVLWRDSDGTQRSRSIGTKDSSAADDERAARRYRRILDLAGEAAADADAARDRTDVEWTVDGWVEHDLAHRSRITEGTRAEYRRMWARTFGPLIGGIPLDLLDKDMVSRAVIDLAARLSYKSVKNARDLLASILTDAVDEGLIIRNPTRRVGIPRVRADQADAMRILTMDEWRRVEPEIPDHWLAILRVLVGTGMRVNEATALQVRSVDLDACSLRITRGWKRAASGWVLGPPKSKKSVRTIELDPVFRTVLAPYVDGRHPDELLFTSRAGNRVHDGNLRARVWQPACKRAGITPPPTIHALRHTHASWLIADGEDMAVVQARLGHESYKTTADVYTHLMPDARLRAATVAARAFTDRQTQITSG